MRRLLIRPGAIGDCIVSFPALESCIECYTEVWIPSTVAPLVRFGNAVRPIASTGLDLVGVGDLEMPSALYEKLRSFDSIISWYGTNRREFREALLRLGIDCAFHTALPSADYTGHAIDFFARQVGAPCGLIPRISIEQPSMKRDAIVIHPFSGSARKNWPLPLFRKLAERLACPVEWTAGPEEALDNAVRFENLSDLAAWLAGARLFIGNDSGIAHLAAAVGVPTLALFGPTSPDIWAPRGEQVIALRADPIQELEIEVVTAAANRLLGVSSARPASEQP